MCTLVDNSAAQQGGAVFVNQDNQHLTINASTLNFNFAGPLHGYSSSSGENSTSHGGALYFRSSNTFFNLINSKLTNNTAAGSGGAMYLNDANQDFTVSGTALVANAANADGGAIFVNTNTPRFTVTSSSTFVGNTAKSRGGAILVVPAAEKNRTTRGIRSVVHHLRIG
jgi:hypothetical protein